MQQYNPFQIVQNSSNRSNKIHMENMDSGNLDNILSNAMKSNDKDVLQSTIGSLLSKVKDPQKQQIGLNLIQSRMQNLKKAEEDTKKKDAYTQLGYNPNLRNLPENLQIESIKNQNKNDAIDKIFGNQQNTPNQQPNQEPNQQLNQQPNATQEGENDISANPNQQGVEPPKQQSFNDLNEDQLRMLTGSPYREISEPAKATLKSLQKEREDQKNLFESESDKLEAKAVAEYSKNIETEYESAKNENVRLDRQLQLDKEGNVSTAALVKVLDVFGIPIGVLQNPATEEYRKLEADYVRDVSKVFPGGKITNYEISAYLKTIPSLMNSEEGRKQIIRNRKLLNAPKILRYQEYEKILKENNGKKPPNLSFLINQRVGDQLDKIENDFVNGIKSDIEKFETPLRMTGPNGQKLMIPPSQVQNALNAGAKF